jgi:hypothetical protein
MPNHCKNLLTVVGMNDPDDEALIAISRGPEAKLFQAAYALAAAHDGMRREDV